MWSIGKWPVLVSLTAVTLTILYFGSPNVRQQGIRPILPGGLLAVAVWIVASIGFAFFVANFGSYDKVYGTLSAVIVMLIWLYISNMAIVFGALFNAERLRGELTDREIPIDLRDEKGKPTPHAPYENRQPSVIVGRSPAHPADPSRRPRFPQRRRNRPSTGPPSLPVRTTVTFGVPAFSSRPGPCGARTTKGRA